MKLLLKGGRVIDPGAGKDGELDVLVEDLRGLMDTLGIGRFGLVSHDVGSYIAQAFARLYSERLVGLFFFHCVYPGIGKRWLEPVVRPIT